MLSLRVKRRRDPAVVIGHLNEMPVQIVALCGKRPQIDFDAVGVGPLVAYHAHLVDARPIRAEILELHQRYAPASIERKKLAILHSVHEGVVVAILDRRVADDHPSFAFQRDDAVIADRADDRRVGDQAIHTALVFGAAFIDMKDPIRLDDDGLPRLHVIAQRVPRGCRVVVLIQAKGMKTLPDHVVNIVSGRSYAVAETVFRIGKRSDSGLTGIFRVVVHGHADEAHPYLLLAG